MVPPLQGGAVCGELIPGPSARAITGRAFGPLLPSSPADYRSGIPFRMHWIYWTAFRRSCPVPLMTLRLAICHPVRDVFQKNPKGISSSSPGLDRWGKRGTGRCWVPTTVEGKPCKGFGSWCPRRPWPQPMPVRSRGAWGETTGNVEKDECTPEWVPERLRQGRSLCQSFTVCEYATSFACM